MSVNDLAVKEKGFTPRRRGAILRRPWMRRHWGWLVLVALALPVRAQEDVLGQMDRQVAAILERVKPSVVSVRAGSRAKRPGGPEKPKPKAEKNAFLSGFNVFEAALTGPAVSDLFVTGDEAPTAAFDFRGGPEAVFNFQQGPDASLFELVPARVGTGFVVDSGGLILTTADVVGGSDQVVVKLSDGRELDGKVLGRDATSGVSAVKVEASDLPALKLASEARLGPGQWTIIVGNQLDRAGSVWVGSVARDDVTLAGPVQGKLLQIHAPVGAGASGAPVLNSRGEVVGLVVAMSGSPWRLGMGDDAGFEKAMTALQGLPGADEGVRKAMAALKALPGAEGQDLAPRIRRIVEEATRKAHQAMERARALRGEHEKKAREGKDDPARREEEEKRLEEQLERLSEEVEREVEALTDGLDKEIEAAVEKSLKESGIEKMAEEHAEKLSAEIERATKEGHSAEEIERAVQKALKDANIEERIRRISEEARRLSEDAAARVKSLHEERRKEIERAKKRGRSGQAERRRLEQAFQRDRERFQRDRERLQSELRRRQQVLQRELRRLNHALPQAPGARSIIVDFAPELAKIAPPARARVRAEMETAFSPPLIALPAIPTPSAAPRLTAIRAVPRPGPVPPRMVMAAPEVRFWSGRTTGDAGMTYAVPVERVRWALEQIREHGRVRHAYLGIKYEGLDSKDRERLKAPEAAQVRVVEVIAGSPAQEAGARPDDLILALDGRAVSEPSEMLAHMARARVGEKVTLEIWRSGERQSLTVTLRERPQAANRIQTWNLLPTPGNASPFIFAPRGDFGKSLRSFVQVGPAGRVAASASGTGRGAKLTLEARDAELGVVLRELSRAAGLKFAAEGDAAKRRVTLKVENVSVDDLVESLSRLYALRVDRGGDRITFRTR